MSVKISVVITTYNRNNFLKYAIQSLINQSFQDWEAIIVDNNIVNDAYEIVCDFKDKRLRYLTLKQNLGECGGRNYAIQNSIGSFICYLDDDDLLPQNSLSSRYEFIKSCADSGMIFGEFLRFREEKEIGSPSFQDTFNLPLSLRKNRFDGLLAKDNFNRKNALFYLKQFNFIRAGTPLIRKYIFNKVGMFDKNLTLFGDYDMWLRITASTKINFLNEVVYFYRHHSESVSTLARNDDLRNNARLLLNKHPTMSNPLIKVLL